MGDVLLDLVGLLQKAHGQDLAAEVPLIQRPLQDRLVKVLKLRERELRRQQLEADRLIADLALEPLQGHPQDLRVVEGQRRRVGDGEPGRVAGVGGRLNAVVADIDQGIIGHGDDPVAGIAVQVAEGVELLQKDLRQAGFLLSSRRAASSSDSST